MWGVVATRRISFILWRISVILCPTSTIAGSRPYSDPFGVDFARRMPAIPMITVSGWLISWAARTGCLGQHPQFLNLEVCLLFSLFDL